MTQETKTDQETNQSIDQSIQDLRTYILSSRLSLNATKQLSTLTDELWLKLQTASSATIGKAKDAQIITGKTSKTLSFDDYNSTRNLFDQTAILATICNHNTLADIFKKWGEMQTTYLTHIINFLENKREDIETALAVHKENVDLLFGFEARYANKWKELTSKIPNDSEMGELNTLREKVKDLESSRKELELYTNAHKLFEQTVEDIKKINNMSYFDKIGRVAIPPEFIFDSLQKGTYTGLPVQKFEVLSQSNSFPSGTPGTKTATAKIQDTQKNEQTDGLDSAVQKTLDDAKNAAAQKTFVNPSEKPQELIALLELKHTIERYTSGKTFSAGDFLKDTPNYLFGAKIIGAYLENLPALFGVKPFRQGAGRRFTKINTEHKSEDEFITIIIENLRPQERSALNKFYLKRALGRIREDPKIGYARFNDKQVREKISEDKLTMELKTIAVNLVKLSSEYGINVLESKEGEREYEFSTINPTNNEKLLVAQTTKTFGYDQFSSNDLCRKLSEEKKPMHPRLVEFILETTYENLCLKQIRTDDKTCYETLERPKSAVQILKAAETTVDMGPLV